MIPRKNTAMFDDKVEINTFFGKDDRKIKQNKDDQRSYALLKYSH